MLDANLCENDPSTYFYCYYRLVCCYGRVALGQRVSESDRTNHADLCLRATSARPASHRTRVALASLDGLFQAPWRGFDTGIFGSGFGPSSFAVGDLDGDGDLDILVGDSFFGSPGISVLKNNGDQTFAAPVYYPVPLQASSRRSGSFGFRFRWRSRRVCNHPRRVSIK